MDVLIDLTDFLAHSYRTGIQRVTRELCVHWPASVALHPVQFIPGKGLELLDDGILSRVGKSFLHPSKDGQALGGLGRNNKRIDMRECRCSFLVPETFVDPPRIAFYQRFLEDAADDFHFLFYDMIPFIAPQLFSPGAAGGMFPYLRLMRSAKNIGFISESAKKDYERLTRRKVPTAPVFQLGSDGLGPREGPSTPQGLFVLISTIEPRKNHAVVLEAFRRLWAEGFDLSLEFVGKRTEGSASFLEDVRTEAENNPRFIWTPSCTDQEVKMKVRAARATIFVSSYEGFGLPPVESLWLGTPVIATDNVPSLEALGEKGLCRVQEPTAEHVRAAVLRMMDADYWKCKRSEAERLALPTWDAFAERVGTWAAGRS